MTGDLLVNKDGVRVVSQNNEKQVIRENSTILSVPCTFFFGVLNIESIDFIKLLTSTVDSVIDL